MSDQIGSLIDRLRVLSGKLYSEANELDNAANTLEDSQSIEAQKSRSDEIKSMKKQALEYLQQ